MKTTQRFAWIILVKKKKWRNADQRGKKKGGRVFLKEEKRRGECQPLTCKFRYLEGGGKKGPGPFDGKRKDFQGEEGGGEGGKEKEGAGVEDHEYSFTEKKRASIRKEATKRGRDLGRRISNKEKKGRLYLWGERDNVIGLPRGGKKKGGETGRIRAYISGERNSALGERGSGTLTKERGPASMLHTERPVLRKSSR